MTDAPDIRNSSEEERRKYIKDRYPCIADCDMCGLCTLCHGKNAELYIWAKKQLTEWSIRSKLKKVYLG